MSGTISLTMDDRLLPVTAGQTILAAAAETGIDIPHLCHLPDKPDARRPCLLCLVEVEKNTSPTLAHTLPAY